MAKPRHIVIGAIVAILLTAGGFVLGRTFHDSPIVLQMAPAPVAKTPQPEPLMDNSSLYDVSPPHKGRAYRSIPVSLGTISSSTALVDIPPINAEDRKVGQKVLLYDKDDFLLDIIGTVTAISGGHDKPTATITIEDTPTVPAQRAVSGDIITQKFPDAQRLPLSALQNDGAKSAYLWEAVQKDDGSVRAIKRTPDTIAVLNDVFFIFTSAHYVSNTYILNPDTSLRNNQAVKARYVAYQAPDVADDEDVATTRLEAIAAYEAQLKDEEAMDKLKDLTDSGTCGTSCGPAPQTTDDFIARIKSLAKPAAQESSPR